LAAGWITALWPSTLKVSAAKSEPVSKRAREAMMVLMKVWEG
jgi:hypothetical protein